MFEKESRQQAEEIRNRYEAKEPTKLDELKKLDKQVKMPATVFAYVFGIVGALVLGVGMCLAMKVIAASLGTTGMILGVVVGIVGIAMAVANYFIYLAIFKSRKKKYGAKILSLSDELLNN